MLNLKQGILLVIAAALAYAGWEAIGHHFLMGLPMAFQHILSIAISTALALILCATVARLILSQHRQLEKLARLREYLAQMESHYLRLPPGSIGDPAQHFESQRRRAQFLDAQQGLASRSPVVRAKAYMEIAAIATDAAAPPPETTALFGQASAHIAAALYLERDSLARAEGLQAVRTLSDFAAARDGELLPVLLNELAHANRSAFMQMQRAIGDWHLREGRPGRSLSRERLSALWRVTRLLENEECGIALLTDILETDEVAAKVASRAAEEATSEAPLPDRSLLSELNATASRLRDTCAAISHAAHRLPAPTGRSRDTGARKWPTDPEVSFEGCFLAGIDLADTHLEGAILADAWLQGSALCEAHLERAVLTDARLRGARLHGADLRWAQFDGADLRGAGVSSADLEGADLSCARLAGAYLIGANLRDTRLWKAEIEEMGNGDRIRADFSRSNWWEASFRDPMTGKHDKAVQAWLSTLFPQPHSEARGSVARLA